MKKIKNYGVTTLHVEELFGYLKQVETETIIGKTKSTTFQNEMYKKRL